jgi:hypothetical protein
MTAYEPERWHDLFVMSGGAAAALAGLIFVAVSLNHQQILATRALPLVAARTLGVLVAVVIMCVFGLTPGQSARQLGWEVLVLAIVLVIAVVVSTVRSNSGGFAQQLDDWAVAVLAVVPILAGGASLLAGSGGGLYWLMIEVVTGLVAAMYYAWLLLIEIRR